MLNYTGHHPDHAMLHPSQLLASPRAHLFDHQLFAHGRLFHRFHGSEACRFSPSAAFRLLAHLARHADGPSTLWDPFCGTGFILTVGAYFFPHAFPAIVASDIMPEATACAARNLALFRDIQARTARRTEMELLMRPNPASRARWSEVAAYFDRLGAALPVEPLYSAEAFTASAADAHRSDERLTIVGDLPYGRASRLAGHGSYIAVLRPLLERHPQARVLLIAPATSAEDFRLLAFASGRGLELRAFKGGRIGARFAPREPRLDSGGERGASSGCPAPSPELAACFGG
jgi:hypothetical protein